MAILFLKLVAVEILSCRFTSAHQKQVITPQTYWVCYDQERIYTHGSWYTPNIERMAEVGVVTLHPDQDMSKTSG